MNLNESSDRVPGKGEAIAGTPNFSAGSPGEVSSTGYYLLGPATYPFSSIQRSVSNVFSESRISLAETREEWVPQVLIYVFVWKNRGESKAGTLVFSGRAHTLPLGFRW